MKKFLIKTLALLILIGIFDVGFCYYIDPYNVFHTDWIRDNGVEPNKNYIKVKYILENPDKFDTFVMGSSRVGNIHVEKLWDSKAYNMTYSEATPQEIYDNLCTFVENGVIPKQIFVGVDSLSYTIDPEAHKTMGISAPYEMSVEDPYNFWKLYLDSAVCFEAYTTITLEHTWDESRTQVFYDYGWNGDYGEIVTTYDFDNIQPSISNSYRLEETLEDIKNIVSLCKEYGIKCTIFTNPMHYVTYEASLDVNYYDFLRGLAEITEFCNFSGYNDITVDNSNWIDNSHYSAEVSDMVRECIAFHAYYEGIYEEGFGQWVNSSNIDEFIELLEDERTYFRSTLNIK